MPKPKDLVPLRLDDESQPEDRPELRAEAPARRPSGDSAVVELSGARQAAPAATAGSPARGAGASSETVALAELLVRLLEQEGPVFHAQSSLRRLLATAIGRELELDPGQLESLALAALLASLGELSFDGASSHSPARQHAVSVQLLQEVPLPAGVREAVAHQHERWDGTGTPDGLREEQIPFLARILAVSRAAAALLAQRAPDVVSVVDELQRQAGSALDPVVVSVLRRVFTHRERHGIGYGWGGRVCVAHPQELRALELATRLHARGYVVETAGGADAVRERVRRAAPQALVLGAGLPAAEVAALVQELRSTITGLPVVVIDAESAEQRVALLAAGADICFPPEVSFTEFKATLDALLRRTETVLPRESAWQLAAR